MFIGYLADDLLNHILNRDQPGHGGIFIDHDGHVIAAVAEFAQQHVQPLAFGDEDRGPHQVLDSEFLVRPRKIAEQVLGQQDARDLLAAAGHDGEA